MAIVPGAIFLGATLKKVDNLFFIHQFLFEVLGKFFSNVDGQKKKNAKYLNKSMDISYKFIHYNFSLKLISAVRVVRNTKIYFYIVYLLYCL